MEKRLQLSVIQPETQVNMCFMTWIWLVILPTLEQMARTLHQMHSDLMCAIFNDMNCDSTVNLLSIASYLTMHLSIIYISMYLRIYESTSIINLICHLPIIYLCIYLWPCICMLSINLCIYVFKRMFILSFATNLYIERLRHRSNSFCKWDPLFCLINLLFMI